MLTVVTVELESVRGPAATKVMDAIASAGAKIAAAAARTERIKDFEITAVLRPGPAPLPNVVDHIQSVIHKSVNSINPLTKSSGAKG
jgi:hypothetical protein